MKIFSQLTLILLFIRLFCGMESAQSQNYQAIKPDAEFYFLNQANKDIIALRIESLASSGSDTYYFGFRQLKQTDYGCYTIHGASWIGDVVTAKSDGSYIFEVYPFSPSDSNDTYRILSRRAVGQSWNFYNYHTINHHLKAKVTEISFQNFIGLSDSVKVITLTREDASGQLVTDPLNGQQILLSKNYGLIRLPRFDTFLDYNFFYDIAGKTNPQTGVTNLKTLGIYDFQPGDELHTVWHSQEWSPAPYTIIDGSTILRVLERFPSTNGDSITYRMEECQSSLYQFSATERSYTHTFDTVYKTYVSAGLLETEPLEPVSVNNDWTTYSFMGYVSDPALPVYDRPAKFINNSLMWSHQSGDCYSQIIFDGCWYADMYLKGLGGPYYNCTDLGWGTSSNLLKYYKKDGVSWGTPLSCDSLLQVGIKETPAFSAFSIYPNPSKGLITVKIASGSHTGILELYDLSSRSVSRVIISQPIQYIDISGLPAGLYGYLFRSGTGELYRGKLIRQ